MQKRQIGKTRVEVSELALGTWGLAAESYGPIDESRFRRVVERGLERDVTTFDLAPIWGDGRSETVVGDVVGDARSEVVYVTRGGARRNADGDVETDLTLSALDRDCDRSLERLKTDHIDVWLLHNPEAESIRARQDEIRTLVERSRKDGRIRAFGASVASIAQARAALDLDIDVLCLPYSILRSELLHELSGDLKERGVTVIARSVLGFGILSGRWGENRSFGELDHRRHRWSAEAIRTRVRQVNRFRFLVHGEVMSLVAASLRYVLANSLVATAVLGPRTTGQLQELIGYGKDGPPYLPEHDLSRIPEVIAETETI